MYYNSFDFKLIEVHIQCKFLDTGEFQENASDAGSFLSSAAIEILFQPVNNCYGGITAIAEAILSLYTFKIWKKASVISMDCSTTGLIVKRNYSFDTILFVPPCLGVCNVMAVHVSSTWMTIIFTAFRDNLLTPPFSMPNVTTSRDRIDRCTCNASFKLTAW